MNPRERAQQHIDAMHRAQEAADRAENLKAAREAREASEQAEHEAGQQEQAIKMQAADYITLAPAFGLPNMNYSHATELAKNTVERERNYKE